MTIPYLPGPWTKTAIKYKWCQIISSFNDVHLNFQTSKCTSTLHVKCTINVLCVGCKFGKYLANSPKLDKKKHWNKTNGHVVDVYFWMVYIQSLTLFWNVSQIVNVGLLRRRCLTRLTLQILFLLHKTQGDSQGK